MDDFNFDPNDIAKIRQMQALGPLQANNQAIGVPNQSFLTMPSPLERVAPGEDSPGLSVPPPQPAIARSPAVVGQPKPASEDDFVPPDDVPDDVVAKDDKGFQKDNSSSIKDLMVTKDDLDKSERKKKIALALGMMGEALANGQSAGNFYLGRMAPHKDIQGFSQKMAGLADAPIEQKKILLAQQLKQPEMELAMRSADPTSTESNLMGNMMKANIQNNQQMTPEQKEAMLKNVDGKSAAELNKLADSPLFKDMMSNDKLFQTLNNKIELANAKAEMMRSLAQAKGGTRTAKDEAQQFKYVENMLEQMRGNPAVQQAEKDLYSSDKANTLMNMYGDKNKLSKEQVKFVVSEIGKIAQGGSPTVHELEGLNPNTFQGNLASAWQKVSNQPEPANLAAFVKQYQDYANGVTSDAEKFIQDRYGRIIDTNADLLNPAQSQKLKENYMGRFNREGRSQRAAEQRDKDNPQMSAEDAAAFQHIKDQPNDPNASAIAAVLKKKYPNLVK